MGRDGPSAVVPINALCLLAPPIRWAHVGVFPRSPCLAESGLLHARGDVGHCRRGPLGRRLEVREPQA